MTSRVPQGVLGGRSCAPVPVPPRRPSGRPRRQPVPAIQTPASSQTQPQPQPFGLPFPSSSLPARPSHSQPASQNHQANQTPPSQTRPLPVVRPSLSRSLLGCLAAGRSLLGCPATTRSLLGCRGTQPARPGRRNPSARVEPAVFQY